MTGMREHAALFGEHRTLVGVTTDPSPSADPSIAPPTAIFLNAGVIHRVGPSRLYVGIARRLASIGWGSARFDHAGIGDSAVRRDGVPFERSAILEAGEVMDSLQESRGVNRFVLIGLCSGAVTAFEGAVADPRVVGAVLINPQGFDDDAAWTAYVLRRGQARRYWRQSLFSLTSWKNALTGRVDYQRLFKVLWRQVAGAETTEQQAVKQVATRVGADLRGVLDRGVRLLMLCSEGDDGIDYLNVILGQDIRKMTGTPRPDVRILPDADHSFTLRESQKRIVDAIEQWASATTFAAASRRVQVAATSQNPAPAERVGFTTSVTY
jgi:pimeloyl-ACP methyl ester carboxylesterase